MSNASERSKLIAYLYRVAVEPKSYDELMAAWDAVISTSASTDNGSFNDTELENHVSQASQILNKLESIPAKTIPLEQSINQDPNPALLINLKGKILAANPPAEKVLQAHINGDISDLGGQSRAVSAALAGLQEIQDGEINLAGLFLVEPTENSGRMMLALSSASCSHNSNVAGLITTLAPLWGRRVIDALRSHFDLSPAESDIVYGLARGRDMNQIARARNKSVNTVRTQMKTILRKVGLESQVELIRLVGLIDRFAPLQEPENLDVAGRGIERNTLILSSGLQMEYTISGPPDGRPVLFIHGMLDGCSLTSAGMTELFNRNIRLIAPSRPWFGNSHPDHQSGNRPWNFAGLVNELLDHLDIKQLPVLGHMAGAVYAASIAARLDKQITAVFNVAGGVPIISPNQFAAMTSRQRLIALTAVKTPQLLPMFLKAGILLIRNGGADAFTKALYREAPVDFEVASRPEVKTYLYNGYLFAISQGHTAFQLDAMEVTKDWSDIVEKIRCPIVLAHGKHDPVVRINSVRDFARRTDNCQLFESPESGQLILANEPGLIFSALDELLTETSPPQLQDKVP